MTTHYTLEQQTPTGLTLEERERYAWLAGNVSLADALAEVMRLEQEVDHLEQKVEELNEDNGELYRQLCLSKEMLL